MLWKMNLNWWRYLSGLGLRAVEETRHSTRFLIEILMEYMVLPISSLMIENYIAIQNVNELPLVEILPIAFL